jgi:hypothetical protein
MSQNAVEISILEIAPRGLPSAGDVRLKITASIDGFAGWADCWVEEREFKRFAGAVSHLYSTFQGEAVLCSMSPGEASLSLSPANSRGYVLVQVTVAKRLPFQCSMSGCFEAELQAVAEIASWRDTPPLPQAVYSIHSIDRSPSSRM